uniref:BTB domain-containing protein n=1 Tax=Meloidogyne hapla TaxID=6305 RepID=A0A1I8BUK9_MELHA
MITSTSGTYRKVWRRSYTGQHITAASSNQSPLQSIAIWLRQSGPNSLNDLVNTKYYIYASKFDDRRIDIAKSTNNWENQDKLGYSEIELNKILMASECCLPETLNLFCEIEYNHYGKTSYLQNNFREMLEKEIFTDCVIKVGDDVIKTHRCVLVQNSEVFQKMFEPNGMTEALNGEVIISDFTPECVRAMLEFFYTGEVNEDTTKNHLDGIFAIAHKYGVEQLKCKCEHIMANLIDIANIVKCCHVINLFGAPVLEKACKNYIQVNNKSFLKSKEWEEIKNISQLLSIEILEYVIDDFNK